MQIEKALCLLLRVDLALSCFFIFESSDNEHNCSCGISMLLGEGTFHSFKSWLRAVSTLKRK